MYVSPDSLRWVASSTSRPSQAGTLHPRSTIARRRRRTTSSWRRNRSGYSYEKSVRRQDFGGGIRTQIIQEMQRGLRMSALLNDRGRIDNRLVQRWIGKGRHLGFF